MPMVAPFIYGVRSYRQQIAAPFKAAPIRDEDLGIANAPALVLLCGSPGCAGRTSAQEQAEPTRFQKGSLVDSKLAGQTV
jgi:hypothetical protein